jgi:hypothetical protein
VTWAPGSDVVGFVTRDGSVQLCWIEDMDAVFDPRSLDIKAQVVCLSSDGSMMAIAGDDGLHLLETGRGRVNPERERNLTALIGTNLLTSATIPDPLPPGSYAGLGASTYVELARAGERTDDMVILEAMLLSEVEGDPKTVTELADHILVTADLAYRDLDFAFRLAEAANEATGGRDPMALYTYGRAWREQGELTKAIQYVREALAQAGEQDTAPELCHKISRTLDAYLVESGRSASR